MRLHPLIDEAIIISSEIPGAIFIGAVAVLAHTKYARESQDLDIAIESIPEQIFEKEYTINKEGRKEVIRTPRRHKVDFYTKDVNGIPIEVIIHTAKDIKFDNRGSIKVVALEILILAKYKTGRDQDSEDLYRIAQTKFEDIDWAFMESICTEYQLADIKVTLNHYRNS